MNKGFTLAEVLITLGIIGIVAAMTIPTLIANTKSQQYRSRLKKTISTLSQAARMSQAQYGFDYSGINQQCGSNAETEHPDNIMSVCAIFNGTLTGLTYYKNATDIIMNKNGQKTSYTIYPKAEISGGNGSRPLSMFRAYTLNDGTIIGLYKDMGRVSCTLDIGKILGDTYMENSNMASCFGFIDVNGVSLPNREVSCSSGSNSLTKNDCIVKNDAQHMTDIFPIRFHDGIAEPATAAGRYVLRTAK